MAVVQGFLNRIEREPHILRDELRAPRSVHDRGYQVPDDDVAPAVQIAETLVGTPNAARAIPALEKAARLTGNPDLAKRARELLEKARP